MRGKLTEIPYAYGKFPNSAVVTIEVMQEGIWAPVDLDDEDCIEIKDLGDGNSTFTWSFDNLTNYPTSFAQYYWYMSDADGNYAQGRMLIGGWPDAEVTTDSASREASKATGFATLSQAEQIRQSIEGSKILDDDNNTLTIKKDDGSDHIVYDTKDGNGDAASQNIKQFIKR